jgi:phosphatidate cytidylyltransferase
MAGVVAVTTPGAPGLFATLVKRALTAVVGIPLFVWMVTGGPHWMFALLLVALSGAAAWELMRMFERAGRVVYGRLGVVGAAAVTASFLAPGFTVTAVFTLAVAATLSVPVWAEGALAVEPVAATLLPIAYVGWFLGHGVLLRDLPDGAHLVLFLVGTTWAGESAAYVIGSAVGRHPLSPGISPRKTVEGAAGQLAASVVAAAVLGTWFVPQWSVATAMLAGGLLGVVGQIGDLGESVIKRSLGAKDTGGLIPGHGGVLDRLDGLLFNTPALFYYASWMGGRG